MATVQSGFGKIEIFEDFCGPEWILGETSNASGSIGSLRVVGQTLTDADTGILILESDGLSGIARFTTPNADDNDSIGLTTGTMFDVAFMGALVAECRVRFDDLDTKEFFFGFSDLCTDTHSLEGVLIHGGSSTITLTASDLCGFLYSAETTELVNWYTVFNGGSETGVTDASEIVSGVAPVADKFNILRLEIDNNGTARWFIDGKLKKTLAGAVSTTTDLACQAILEIKGTGDNETADIDYILIEANRDWTV